MAKLLFVGAHPDDETFQPGATLAKYTHSGHEVEVVCATRGEAGMWSDVKPDGNLGEVREQEHKKSAEILGVKNIEYLDYFDGTLANKDVKGVTEKLLAKIEDFRPEVIITLDEMGISGHIDHIVMSLAATKAYFLAKEVKKLYYYTIPHQLACEIRKQTGRMVWGRPEAEITTQIDVAEWINTKIEAAKCHLTQIRDVEKLIPWWEKRTTDYFVLEDARVETKIPEDGLL